MPTGRPACDLSELISAIITAVCVEEFSSSRVAHHNGRVSVRIAARVVHAWRDDRRALEQPASLSVQTCTQRVIGSAHHGGVGGCSGE